MKYRHTVRLLVLTLLLALPALAGCTPEYMEEWGDCESLFLQLRGDLEAGVTQLPWYRSDIPAPLIRITNPVRSGESIEFNAYKEFGLYFSADLKTNTEGEFKIFDVQSGALVHKNWFFRWHSNGGIYTFWDPKQAGRYLLLIHARQYKDAMGFEQISRFPQQLITVGNDGITVYFFNLGG